MNGYTVMRYAGIGAFGAGLGLMDVSWWVFVLLVGGLVFYVHGVMDQ